MSSTSKIAVITAASIGMVLTQSSSLLAENQDRSEVIKIAAPIDLDEDVLYSPLSDEVLEKAALALGGVGVCSTSTCVQTCLSCGQVTKPPYASKNRAVKSSR